jgi:SAM-dependent methyltransferase
MVLFDRKRPLVESDPSGIYDDGFYESQVNDSLYAARIYLKHLWRFVQPASVLDVGCGRGMWLKACHELGSEKLWGFDGAWNTQSQMVDSAIYFHSTDLNQSFSVKEKFDLAMSLEVAEHLDPSAASVFVRSLTEASDTVLFSAAYTKQGGTNHINEQPHSYWALLFAKHGFMPFDLFRPVFWGVEDIRFWYRQNTFLYIKQGSAAFSRMENNGLRMLADISFMNCIHPELYNFKAAQAESILNFKDHLMALLPSLRRAIHRRLS